MFDADRWPPEWTGYVIVILTFLAPILGGSTSPWAQGSLILLTGVFFVLAPPRRSLGPSLNTLFFAIALVPLLGFLPSRFLHAPAWRIELTKLGVAFPPTLSPQPWLMLEAACLFWFGLVWAYYLFAYEWKPSLRETAWDLFCVGILGLAATLTVCYAIKLHVPFWPNVQEFGFFPNRNQTSNVLGLGGVFMYANAFRHLQHERRRGWLWLAGLALVCWALILNFSRGGIILFFAGTFVWHIWWLITSRTATRKLIAWGPLAILVALLLLAGGTTWLRFRHESVDLVSLAENGRVLIQRDAIDLFKTSPVLGTGLGNFRSLFTAARHFYTSSSEAIHPESDWLWLAVETGFVGPVLLLVGLIAWLWRSVPFRAGTWRAMRVAGLICGIGFAIHGLFDVSGHRLGSLWPALFLAGTALNPQIRNEASAMVVTAYRVLGPTLSALGMWWLASSFGANVGPTSTRLAQLSAQLERVSVSRDYNRNLQVVSEGLAIAPLSWLFYYQRGLAEAHLYQPRPDVIRDFAVARYLLPNWPDLYIKEGMVWLNVAEPDLAFEVWGEGMRRCGDNAPDLYSQIFNVVKDDPDLRDRWRQLGLSDKKCFFIFLQNAESVETRIELERVFSEDPQLQTFNRAEKKVLFHTWYQRGEKLALATMLQEHPEWREIAWPELARAYADYQDYRPAYQTVMRFLAPPNLPEIDPRQSTEALVTRFRINRDSGNDGLVLATAQFRSDAIDQALTTISIASNAKRAPRALHYLEARIWAQKEDWLKAWQAIAQYDDNLR